MPKGHPSHKVIVQPTQAKKSAHEDEKIALVFFYQVVLPYGIFFDKVAITLAGYMLKFNSLPMGHAKTLFTPVGLKSTGK